MCARVLFHLLGSDEHILAVHTPSSKTGISKTAPHSPAAAATQAVKSVETTTHRRSASAEEKHKVSLTPALNIQIPKADPADANSTFVYDHVVYHSCTHSVSTHVCKCRDLLNVYSRNRLST